ncbi:MAG: hypothetical protein HOI80_06450 [Alphaproteobacteria bacterium]|nr:hypothetical protein [Alphaproteobacteria bacterium]
MGKTVYLIVLMLMAWNSPSEATVFITFTIKSLMPIKAPPEKILATLGRERQIARLWKQIPSKGPLGLPTAIYRVKFTSKNDSIPSRIMLHSPELKLNRISLPMGEHSFFNDKMIEVNIRNITQ